MDDGGGGAVAWRFPALHAVAAGATIALFGGSGIFDVVAARSSDQYVYSQGAAYLLGIGLLAGVVAIVALVADVGPLPSGPVRRALLWQLVATDLGELWFAFVWWHRRPHPALQTEPWLLAVSALVLVVLAAAVLFAQGVVAAAAGTTSVTGADDGT